MASPGPSATVLTLKCGCTPTPHPLLQPLRSRWLPPAWGLPQHLPWGSGRSSALGGRSGGGEGLWFAGGCGEEEEGAGPAGLGAKKINGT